jgi:2-amino-4-hydroxy-6-hydroxymethyldihydropteridine diphosphokinase
LTETVHVGLGANLGDRERTLHAAVEALGRIDAVAVQRVSSLYESAPVGPPQPRFLNAVVELECGLPPKRLLGILKQIERDLGRNEGGQKWGPRAIDLDILVWEDRVVADPNLQIPHLELHKRRFALEPLCELCPELRHPLMGKTLAQLLSHLTAQDVVRLDVSLRP